MLDVLRHKKLHAAATHVQKFVRRAQASKHFAAQKKAALCLAKWSRGGAVTIQIQLSHSLKCLGW